MVFFKLDKDRDICLANIIAVITFSPAGDLGLEVIVDLFVEFLGITAGNRDLGDPGGEFAVTGII